MRHSVLALVALLLTPAAHAQPTTAPIAGKLGTPVQLFNGKDFTGWIWITRPSRPSSGPSGAPAASQPAALDDVWSVRDGVIVCKGRPAGYLRTTKTFSNYVLSIEYRHVTRGNGGFFVGISGPDKVWPRCIEVQGAFGQVGDLRNTEGIQLNVDPARVGEQGKNIRKLAASSEKPVGEWNALQVVVDHGNLSVTVNGQVQNQASEVEDLTGAVGLQSEGAQMEFRSVVLTPIESP